MQAQQHEIITLLFRKTYLSNDTHEIKQVERSIYKLVSNKRFVPTLHLLLKNAHPDVMTSISIYFKKIAQYQLELQQSNTNEQKFTRIHQIYQIITDMQISPSYKIPIVESYIQLYFKTNFYHNHHKLLSNIKYLYETKSTEVAAIMTQSLSNYPAQMQAKKQLYQSALPCLINLIVMQFQKYFKDQLKSISPIKFGLQALHQIIVQMDFELFPEAAQIICRSQNLIHIFSILLPTNSEKVKQFLFENYQYYIIITGMMVKILNTVCQINMKAQCQFIIQKICQYCVIASQHLVSNINLPQSNKTPNLISLVKLLNSTLENNLMTYHKLVSTKLLIESISHLIGHKINEYLCNIIQFDQLFNLFHDICFDMKSQCLQVQLNKFVWLTIERNIEVERPALMIMYQSVMQSTYDDKLIEFGLIVSSLLVKTIIKHKQVMLKLQHTFIKLQQVIKKNQLINCKLIFINLWGYYNYIDDLFQSPSTNLCPLIIPRFFINRKPLNEYLLIGCMLGQIINHYFQQGYPYHSEQSNVNLFIQCFHQSLLSKNPLSQHQIKIFSTIVKQYGKLLEVSIITNIIESIFMKLQQQTQNCNHKLSALITLLENIFNLPNYQQYFEYFLAKLKQITLKINSFYQFSLLFDLIINYVKVKCQIPNQYQNIITQYYFSFRQSTSFQLVNYLVVYADQKTNIHMKLIQKIIKQCLKVIKQHRSKKQKSLEIKSILLIHIAIYYHHQRISYQLMKQIIIESLLSLKSNEFNFVKGKYKLAILLILFYQPQIFYQIVENISQNTNQISQIIPPNSNSCIEEYVYEQLYIECNDYRVDYDISIFINYHIQLFSSFDHPMQIKYANVSTIAIIRNIQRLYDQKVLNKYQNNCNDDSSQSDNTNLYPPNLIQKQYNACNQILRTILLPICFRDINVFQMFRQFLNIICSDQQTLQWYQKQVQRFLSFETKSKIKDMIHLVKLDQNNYRKVVTKQSINIKYY